MNKFVSTFRYFLKKLNSLDHERNVWSSEMLPERFWGHVNHTVIS